MAIKRTLGRSKFVTPSNIVVDSGGQAMAQATDNIGKAIGNIGETIDTSQLQTAIIEAEKQGKQIGTRVDENNVPIPLDQVTLNSFTFDMYNNKNLEKAQSYFKKQAINSYGLALQNDAFKNANTSVQNNLGKIGSDGKLLVQTASNSYINNIKAHVSNEVWNAISPGLNKIWGDATRKASAYQMDSARKLNVSNALTSLDYILNQESNFIINGAIDELEYETIETIKQNAFQLLVDNGSDGTVVNTAKLSYSTKLQSRVSTNAINMAHTTGMSDGNLLMMSKEISDAFKDNKNVDHIDVYNSMITEISRLNAIDTKNEKDIKDNSLIATNNILVNMLVKGEMPTTVDINSLQIGDQLKVQLAIAKQNKLLYTNGIKNYNDSIKKKIDQIKHKIKFGFNVVEQEGDDYSQDDISWLKNRKKHFEIQSLMGELNNKDLDITTQAKIFGLANEVALSYAKENSAVFKANINLAMNGNTAKVLIPSQLRHDDYVNNLIKNNIIGNGPEHAFTRDGWFKLVDEYEKDYKKTNLEAQTLRSVANSNNNGIPLNPEQKTSLDKIVKTTFKIEGNDVDFDVLSKNPEVREASIKHYTALAITTKHLPEPLKDIFNNINSITNDEVFSFAKQAYFSVKQEYINANGGLWGGGKTQWEIFSGKDRNNLKINLLDSTFETDDASKFASVNNSVSAKRNLGSIFPHLSESELTDHQLVTNGILEVLEQQDNWFGLFSSVDGNETENKAVRAWYEQQGGGNFNTAIINNPYILNEITKNVKYKALNHGLNLNKPEEALLSAIKSEIYNMTGRLSLNTDKNGTVHLMLGAGIVRQSQSQIPTKYPLEITKEAIIKDMLFQYNSSFGGGTQNEFIKEAIKREDIMFIPNNEKIGQPTFKVVVFAEDGNAETLSNNYRWDWNNSQLNEDYEDAIKKITNGGVRQLLSSFDFMSKNNLDAVMGSIKSNRDRAETWIGIVNTYNKIALGFNNMPTSPNNMLPIIDYIKSENGKKELQDYFDDKRFLRFDLR